MAGAAGLEAEDLRDRLEDARDDKTPLRLTVQGEEYYPLPWELLFHEHPNIGFLGLHPWCVISRRIRGRGNKVPSAGPKPLRILLFISSPEDLDPEQNRLDFEREEELLFTALDGPYSRGEIDIDVAENGMLSTLVDRLTQDHYQAVILSMHGTPAVNGSGQEEWGLLFEDEQTWKGRPVAGSDLAPMLERLPSGHHPSLVVLAACRSAKADETAESILDVARHLHQAGIERVLGMRLSVLDGAAAAFNAALFAPLVLGESVGRAVSLARQAVGAGAWLSGAMGDIKTDPFAQWTLPILLDRTSDGPLVDLKAPAEIQKRPPLPDLLPGDGLVPIPSRAAFIGRRVEIRQALGPFLEGKTRLLMFTGPGGVGKTALAGLFARHLMDRSPGLRILGFRAPFHLDTIYEPIREAAFDGHEEPGLQDAIQKELDPWERLRRMLVSLAQREGSLALVLDNLETLQDLASLDFAPKHQDSQKFLDLARGLPFPARVLMTGRYNLDNLLKTPVTRHPVGQASFGDILLRMRRLEWPQDMPPERKRWIYQVLGGNHRAIEWLAQLLDQAREKSEGLLKALEGLAAPPETPEEAVAAVTEALRQDLLFQELRAQLTPGQDRLLRAASLYRTPVHQDGLEVIDPDNPNHAQDQARLLAYGLLEQVRDRSLDLDYFLVPPIVRELLGDLAFEPEELKALHQVMGRYHQYQGEYVTRRLSDYLEAIFHYRRAENHEDADPLAYQVTGFYYSQSNYAEAVSLLSEIVDRPAPPPPWWALNMFGLCQLSLGSLQTALEAFERARPICPSKKDQSATLNNISLVYGAQGDNQTALEFLEQSLKIIREIGDKAGEGAILNSISQIYQAQGDYRTALEFLEQSLKITGEMGNKTLEGAILCNMGRLYDALGEYPTALKYLEQSLKIRREIGDKAGESTTLNNIGAATHAQGDYQTALNYLEQSLKIKREIGKKAGLIATMHNMALIALEDQDLEKAVGLWSEALNLALETKEALGMYHVGRDFGHLLAKLGNKEQARELLTMALQVGRAAGFPTVNKVEALLKSL